MSSEEYLDLTNVTYVAGGGRGGTDDLTTASQGSKSEAGLRKRPGTRRRETGVQD